MRPLLLERPQCLVAVLAAVTATTLVLPDCSSADLRTVIGEGEYRMGDRDTREDAVRLATEEAKRHALEQVATYIESISVSNAVDMTKDEIRTYTAGVVHVIDQEVRIYIEQDAVIVRADVTALVDPDEVTQAITALRKNEEAREQVRLLKTEVDTLHRELADVSERLAAAMSPEQWQLATERRQDLLSRVESNEALGQAWTNWALVPWGYPAPWIGMNVVQGLWAQAWSLYPANPHLVVLQRVLPVQVPQRVGPVPPGVFTHVPRFRSGPLLAMPAPHPRRFSSRPLSTVQPPLRLPPAIGQVRPRLPTLEQRPRTAWFGAPIRPRPWTQPPMIRSTLSGSVILGVIIAVAHPALSEPPRVGDGAAYSEQDHLIGIGQGDLSKGLAVCQRVSELAARADVAKQIRVLVKEHAMDRVRERTGHALEQDIEIIREEEVRELLHDVRIVERKMDPVNGVCTSVATMPKSRIPAPDK